VFALGNLVSCVLKNGTKMPFIEANNLLIWDGDTKRLLITVPIGSKHNGPILADSDYTQFHADSTARKMMVEWFAPSKKHTINYGLIRVINYYVPKEFASAKADKEYSHQFGDCGDRYVPPGSAILPMLRYDTKRDWYYIQRRPGNKWTVDDYIRG
jgi:hypothetical protein